MNRHILRFKAQIQRSARTYQERRYDRRQKAYDRELSFSEAVAAFPDPNDLYAYMHHYFRHKCPQLLREHRAYFVQDDRGFGEDAFHAMWWLLVREFRPKTCLEIGVYRGQIISLWALISQLLNLPCKVHGISPFTAIGDGVSLYREDLNYLQDTRAHFDHWQLPSPVLVRGLSTDLPAVNHVVERTWDLIYIDGSHEFEIALADYRLCRDYLKPGGLLVMDDASLGTSFHPPLFAFAGHVGPSRVAVEYAIKELRFLGAVGHNNVFIKESGDA